MRRHHHKPSPLESGAVLVLTALMLVFIFGMVALVVDVGKLHNSSNHAKQTARLAVLGSISAYMKAEEGTTDAARLELAARHVNHITGLNVRTIHYPGTPETLGADGTSGDLTLQPGQYFYSMNSDGSNPCDEGDPPCFVPQGVGDAVTAMRLSGQIFGKSNTIFGRIFGVKEFEPIVVDATASAIATNVLFLVDISPSMVRETHLKNSPSPDPIGNPSATPGPGDPTAAEYAYYLSADNGTAPTKYDEGFAALEASRSGTTVVTKHYQDDYGVFTPLTDADYADPYTDYHPAPSSNVLYQTSGRDGVFRIDTYREDGVYEGPEPLMTVLRGIRTAVTNMKARALQGDKVGVLFYTDQLAWPRVINLTDDFEYLENLLDPNDPNTLAAHRIFPDPGGFTSTMVALFEATHQFETYAEPNVPHQNRVVLVGDGLPTCTGCSANADQNDDDMVDEDDVAIVEGCEGLAIGAVGCEKADLDGDGLYTTSDTEIVQLCVGTTEDDFGCNNTYDSYQKSIELLVRTANNNFAPDNVPIDVIMVGSHVGPHTYDISEDGNCLSQSQIRQEGLIPVRPGDFAGSPGDTTDPESRFIAMSPENPFYDAGLPLYEIAGTTGGIFGMIQPYDPGAAHCVTACDLTGAREETACTDQTTQMQNLVSQILDPDFVIVESN